MANEKRVVGGGIFGIGNKATGMRFEFNDGTTKEERFNEPVSEIEAKCLWCLVVATVNKKASEASS